MTSSPGWPKGFVVPEAKILEYLLNIDHNIGGPKAKFFLAFGFTKASAHILAMALLDHTQRSNLTETSTTPRGHVTLVFEGVIRAPDGRQPHVRSVWQIDDAGTASLVTAIPLPGKA